MESSNQQDCDYLCWRSDKEILSYIKDGKFKKTQKNSKKKLFRNNPPKRHYYQNQQIQFFPIEIPCNNKQSNLQLPKEK